MRLILAGNVEFVRGTTQTLQALSAALLTASVAATVALSAVPRFRTVPLTLAVVPTACFAGALIALVVTGVARRGQYLVVGDVEQTMLAYEKVLTRRRQDLLVPGLLAACGIIAALAILMVAGSSVRSKSLSPHQRVALRQLNAVARLMGASVRVDDAISARLARPGSHALGQRSVIGALRREVGAFRSAIARVSRTQSAAITTAEDRLLGIVEAQLTIARKVVSMKKGYRPSDRRALEAAALRYERRFGGELSAVVGRLAKCVSVAKRC